MTFFLKQKTAKIFFLHSLISIFAACNIYQPYEANPAFLGQKSQTFHIVHVVSGPLSYQTSTLKQARIENSKIIQNVEGRACQEGFFLQRLSVAWGDGGFIRALDQASKKFLVDAVYDIRIDEEHFAIIFGIYQKVCLKVAGTGIRYENGNYAK